MGRSVMDLATRFWGRVSPEDPVTGCRVWTLSLFAQTGYGQVRIAGKARTAHRVAWELTHGPIPPGIFVLHKCDNRPCCNPDHLFLGTQADNVDDMTAKGRSRRRNGPTHPSAKLTAATVVEARKRVEAGESIRAVARSLGMSHTAMRKVIDGRTWKAVK